jgi:RimJ/RimL family protein N-acetyltransferase
MEVIDLTDIPILKGNRVILRKIQPKDIDDRFAIGRHNEFEHMCGGDTIEKTIFPPRQTWIDWYNSHKDEEYSWIIEYEDKCIGSARLHNISAQDRCATYAIGIWDVDKLSLGLGTETTMLVLKYAFETMQLHRVELKVLEYNKRGIRCYEKCGFQTDGVLRENAWIDCNYYSDVIMSILESEWN